MTTTQPWQLEIADRTPLLGAGTPYRIIEPGLRGFTGYPVVANDQQGVNPGSVPGTDRMGVRILQTQIHIDGDAGSDPVRQASVRLKAQPVVRGWRPSRRTIQRLDSQLPGTPETVMSFFGRPRDLDEGDWLWTVGALRLTLVFHAVDPYAYGAIRTLTEQPAGTVTLPADDCGEEEARSARALIVVHGNGGTPSIVNPADADNDITFNAPISGDVVLDLDMQTATQTVTDDVIGLVAGPSPWFEIEGGVDNDLQVSGCDGITVTWRPAYH